MSRNVLINSKCLSRSGLDVGEVSVAVSEGRVTLEGTVKDRHVSMPEKIVPMTAWEFNTSTTAYGCKENYQ